MNGEAKSSMVREVGEIAWALIGGVCGALVADRLVGAGMRTERAALAVAASGALAGMALRGRARSVAVGASTACVGQLSLMWLQTRATAAIRSDATIGNVRPSVDDSRSPRTGERDDARARQPVIEMPVESRIKEPERAVDSVATTSPEYISGHIAANVGAARPADSQAMAPGRELGSEPPDLGSTP